MIEHAALPSDMACLPCVIGATADLHSYLHLRDEPSGIRYQLES
ncbi:MAG: hypothetical protein ACRDTJ_23405 [Pseudonocardiaceae bacterium]